MDNFLAIISTDAADGNIDLPAVCNSISATYESLPSVKVKHEESVSKPGFELFSITNHESTMAAVSRTYEYVGAIAGRGRSIAVLAATRARAGSMEFDQGIPGLFAAIKHYPFLSRTVAWCSRPAVKKVYWARTTHGFVVSSEALLCASYLAYVNKSAVRLDNEYLRLYLSTGYGLGTVSPFAGVSTLGPEEALVLGSSARTVRKRYYNTVDFDGATEVEKAQLLGESFTSPMRDECPGPELALLRLSGGKDSRCLLAGLSALNIPAIAETRSATPDLEYQVSQQLAAATGYELVRAVPKLAVERDIRASAVDTLRRTRGLGLAEAHQIMYEGAAPHMKGAPLLMGHSHIQRGGFAHVMKNTMESSAQVLYGQIATSVAEETAEPAREHISRWMEGAWTKNPLELQYEYHVQHRAAAYIAGHYTDYSSQAKLVYPMLDQKFVANCDAMTMFDKVSERIVFLMVRNLSNSMLGIPLKESTWRFEVDGPKDISGDDFELRNNNPLKIMESYDTPGAYQSMTLESLGQACVLLRNEPTYDQVRSLLSDDLVQLIGSPDPVAALEEVSRGTSFGYIDNYKKMIWRSYAAAVWMSGDWL